MANFSSWGQGFNGWKTIAPLIQQPWFWRSLMVVWILVPLLCGFFDLEQLRLIAHDEGLYATRARTMLRQQDWIHPWETVHHKTPGSYWILATMFQLFGVNEVTARFPSVVASVICGLLLFELAKDLFTPLIAWVSVGVLSTAFLWVQYSRFATPDLVFIALLLGGLVCLLKAEVLTRYQHQLRFVAGVAWGLAFLVRSFLMLLPIAALMPYLLLDNRRHRHLYSLWFYGGLALGLLPVALWLWACWQRFGDDIFQSLLKFPVRKAAGGDDPVLGGALFYFTSIQLNSWPWGILALLGSGVLLKSRPTRQQVLLVGGYVGVVLGALSLSSTHLHHYALVLYPLLALLAALALVEMGTTDAGWLRRSALAIALFLSGLGALLVLLSVVLMGLPATQFPFVPVARPYVPVALTLGLAWCLSGLVWLRSGRRDRWLMGLLCANWLTLSVAGMAGILGNGDLALKTFLLQPEVETVLADNTIHFAPLQGKLSVLIRFYTPRHGLRADRPADLPEVGYAWVWASDLKDISVPYQVVDQFNEVVLVQLSP